ncbi:MAG: S8 family serine peptidase, partial [Saprospiraceae bacterium]|nr:S8 family serine peptidase [Saprospiraceae bacterium]
MTRILTCLFCLCTAFATAQQTQPAHFAWGKEQLPANFHLEKGKHHVSDGELVNGKYVRFIQFERTLSERQRTEVEKLGLQFIGYVYPSVYLTLIPQDFELGKLETFDPYSIVALQPAWKMAKTLKEPPYGDWAVSGDWVSINLQVYPNVSMEEKKAWCESNGMELIKIGTQNNLIQVRVLIQELTDIAALPFVQYLELIPPPGQPEDTDGRSLHRSNTIDSDHGAGLKLNGAGVKALVRDDGNLGPHIDFQGRLFNRADRPAEEANHGDGVGGVMGGAGNLDPTKKGMAAGADIYTVDYVNDFQDETLPLHLNEGITITNTSYSDFCNAGYTTTTQTVDQQLFQHPTLMHVFSAGNANGQDCGYGAGAQWGNITGGHKMAKNAIATANLNVDATINNYSSRGPAYDGRLKPDISAYGEGQGSTDIDNTYWAFSGTSAAAPGIAGCLAQLTQVYKVNNGGQNPPSALLKAAILNTANDLGNAGPDFRFGWGHINVWRAYKLLTSQNYIAGAVDNNGTATHQVNVPANLNQVRFMVVWADPPASPLNSKALLNDLDLKVTTPDGATTYLPWKLNPTPNPTALNSAAVQGRDSLNNVEQVTISLPAEGAYQIQLIGTDVPFGPQDYHLVWEFVYDSIKLIYPNGGEGFAPGELQRIQWDAPGNTVNFQLSYSTDGGTTFTPIGNQLSTRRMYNWTVPNTVS